MCRKIRKEMKEMKKTIFLLVTCVCLMIGLSVTVSAATVDSGSCGDNAIWTLDDEGTLTISGTGEMDDYSYEYGPPGWTDYEKEIVSIKVEEGITSIGYDIFRCSNAVNISFPETLTSIGRDTINNTAYYSDETNWENGILYIGNYLITSKNDISGDVIIKDGTKIIADNAFNGRTNITSVNIPDSVNCIGYCSFRNCTSLSKVTVGKGVTSIGDGSFGNCPNLKTVLWNAVNCDCDRGNNPFDNSGTNVENMSVVFGEGVKTIPNRLFQNCSTLSNISIPSTITKVGEEAFYGTAYYNDENNWENGILYIGCVLISGEDAQGEYIVKDGTRVIADLAFKYAFDITKITLPNSVVTIGDEAFLLTRSMKTIVMSEKLERIGNEAFYQSSIESINIPASVISIGTEVFSISENLTQITVSDGNTKYTSVDGVLYNIDKTEIIEYPSMKAGEEYVLPETVKIISNNAFDYCKYLKKVSLPDGLTTIGNAAFRCSYIISEINIPDTVTYIGVDAFCQCRSLKTINIPNGITDISAHTFSECTSLENVSFPDTLLTIGDRAFEYCSNLNVLNIPKTVTYIGGGAFYRTGYSQNDSNWENGGLYINNCLAEVNTEGITDFVINDGTKAVAAGLFSYKSELTSVTVPGTVTVIPERMFYQCENLKSVNFGSGIKEIKREAFGYCSKLENIQLPDTLEYIERFAFENCENLTEVIIPDSVIEIAYDAYAWCYGITDITLGKNLKTINGAFRYSNKVKQINWNSVAIEKASGAFSQYANEDGDGLTVIFGDAVESIPAGVFSGHRTLATVTLGENIKKIGSSAFGGCINLTTLYWNAKSVRNFTSRNSPFSVSGQNSERKIIFGNKVEIIPEYAFYSGPKMSLEFSDSIASIGAGAFENCRQMTEVVLPPNVETIGERAFIGCTSLTDVTVPISLKNIGENAFYRCTAIQNVTYLGEYKDWRKISIDTGNEYLVNAYEKNNRPTNVLGDDLTWSLDSNGVLTISGTGTMYDFENFAKPWENEKELIKELVIEDGVTTIGSFVFDGCANLKKVTIPSSIIAVSKSAFINCTNIAQVYTENLLNWCSIAFNNARANPLSYNADFYVDNKLIEELVIPEGVTNIGYGCFYGCGSIKTATIPSTLVNNHQYWFGRCPNLTAISVSENNPQYCSKNGNLFSKDGSIIYQYCIGKTDAEYIVDATTKKIAPEAFRNAKIKSIIFHDDVYIENYAFYNCSSLTEVILPKNTIEIMWGIFYNCSSLVNVEIPNSVQKINGYVFDGCTNLSNIYYDGTQESWNNIQINTDNSGMSNATIHFSGIPKVRATVSADGKSFVINPENIENGNVVLLALYKGNTFVKLYDAIYQGESVPFTVTEDYDNVKIMVWSDYKSLTPKCNANSSPMVIE